MTQQAEDELYDELNDEILETENAEETSLDKPETNEEPAEEVEVMLGNEESPPQDDEPEEHSTNLVNKLRKMHREAQKEAKKLREELAKTKTAEQVPATLGKKPTLEDSDYDADKFEAALLKWTEAKRKADDEAAAKRKVQDEADAAWKQTYEGFQKAPFRAQVRDYEDAEEVVDAKLSELQKGMIIAGTEKAPELIYALGKRPKELERLAAIKNHVEFAVAVGELVGGLKVSTKSGPPAPERTVRGTGSGSSVQSRDLEKLHQQCLESGDMTPYYQRKRALDEAAKKRAS